MVKYKTWELSTENPPVVSFKQHLSDFANVFKAFIGCNYLTISFAFKQSGLILGLIGLAVVAALTDLCCHIIVKCKYAAMTKLMKRMETHTALTGNEMDEDEKRAYYHRIIKSLQYGDIGMLAMGRTGRVLVNTFIGLTQFGFCVAYFIFIGNTVISIFACQKYAAIPISNNSHLINKTVDAAFQHLPAQNLKSHNYNSNQHAEIFDGHVDFSFTNGTDTTTTLAPHPKSTTHNPNPWSHILKSASTCLPPLSVLILIPIPLFIAFALIRNVRQLGIISILADVAIFGGILCMLIYLAVTFQVTSFSYVEWTTFPIFVGAVTSSYEGIGTYVTLNAIRLVLRRASIIQIIPIESSMEGNRQNFPLFLHIAILGLSALLAVLGCLGYISYGDEVKQMLNLNILTTTNTYLIISKFIDVTLVIGILLTFPLQIFPVIELLETYLFTEGMPFGPTKGHSSELTISSSDDTEGSTLINTPVDDALDFTVAVEIPRSVSTWKRNLLRILIVLACCGVSIACRNIYAYLTAFIGAVGSTMLAFILPCIFQIVLCRAGMSRIYLARNVAIIIFGIFAGVVSVYSIITKLLSGSL